MFSSKEEFVEAVKKAYKTTGMRPIRGVLNDTNEDGFTYGCAIGALRYANDPQYAAMLGQEHFAFWMGVHSGFDGRPHGFADPTGREYGQAAAAAVFGEEKS